MAGLLVGATLLGRWALAGMVGVLQALLLLGLVRGSDVPAARTSGVIALVIGLGALALVATGPEVPVGSAELVPVAAAPGAALVAMAVVQLARRDGRARLTSSLSFGVTSAVLASAGVLWLALGSDPDGETALLVALAGAATAAAFAVFPGPRLLWTVGGTVAAAGVGLLVQASDPAAAGGSVDPGPATVLAAAAGVAAVAGLWVCRLVAADGAATSNAAGAGPPDVPRLLTTASIPLVLSAAATLGVAWILSV